MLINGFLRAYKLITKAHYKKYATFLCNRIVLIPHHTVITVLWGCVCCYLTQLSYSGNSSFPSVLPVHGVLFEKQEDLVIFGVVTLRDQVYAYKSGVYKKENRGKINK